MKRFHHQLLVICALVLMFALAASLSPAAYAEYPHRRGNRGLKADDEMTQQARLPESGNPVDSAENSGMPVDDETEGINASSNDKAEEITDPSEDEADSFPILADAVPDGPAASADEEQDPDAQYDNNLDDLDIEEILEANTYESVMGNHSAFTVKTVTNPDVTGYGTDGFYCGTDGYNYYEYETEAGTNATAAILITERNLYRLIRFADGDTGFYVEWDADPTRPGVTNDLAESCMSLDAEAFLREIMIDVEDSAEGTLRFTTADDTSALEQRLVELPEEWEDGIILRTYELDRKSLEIQALSEVLLTADDEEVPLLKQTVCYREEPSETLQMMLDKADCYEEGRFADPCEVTVIYDPGTEEELTCNVTIEKGDSVLPVFLDGYDLYMDEQQRYSYMGVGGSENMTIYAFSSTGSGMDPEFGPWSETEGTDPYSDDAMSLGEAIPGPYAATLDAAEPEALEEPAKTADEAQTFGPGSDEVSMRTPGAGSPAEDELRSVCGSDEMLFTPGSAGDDDEKSVSAPGAEEIPAFASGPADAADEKTVPLPWANMPGELLPVRSAGPAELAAEELETGIEPGAPADEELLSAVGPADLADAEDKTPDGGFAPETEEEEPGGPLTDGSDALPVGPVTDEDFSALMKDLYIANKLDLIFLNHKSVEYLCTYDFDAAQGYSGYTYETAGMAYYEDPDSAAYASDSAFYRLTMDERGTDLSYVFDFCNDYDPHLNAGYELVPETFEDWWDAEAESVTECYVEDGFLFLRTEMNEQKSREFLEDWLKADFDGEIVTTEIKADAESREVLRFAYHVEKNGEESTPVLFEVAYDQPMPRTARMLRAIAERDTDWTATITVVMNPGTKDEASQTMTVPVGSTVAYATDAEVHMFEDRNCTLPADNWDGKTSQTYYLMPVSGLSAKM